MPGPSGSMYDSGLVQASAGDVVLLEKRKANGSLAWNGAEPRPAAARHPDTGSATEGRPAGRRRPGFAVQFSVAAGLPPGLPSEA